MGGLGPPPSGDAGLIARGRARLGGMVEPRHGEEMKAKTQLKTSPWAG